MAGKWGLLALALLACSASAATEGRATNGQAAKGQAAKEKSAQTTVTRMTAAKSVSTLTVEEQIWIDTHNMARARYGRKPLIWDEGLERDARIWARQLARTGQFEHANVTGQGENLWMGTRAAFPLHSMVQSWIVEEAFLKSGTFPDVSTSGNWADVGHMTQLLWPTTTHVGCAKASNAADDYLVCRYSPPGNWTGEAFDARRK